MDSLVHTADALQWAGFASIFTYSFLVSLHCIGMCGPLACSLIFRSRLKPWVSSALYNLGRTISYTLAGALASLLLGIGDVAGKYYFPTMGPFVIYTIMIAILIWRPNGLFGRTAVR